MPMTPNGLWKRKQLDLFIFLIFTYLYFEFYYYGLCVYNSVKGGWIFNCCLKLKQTSRDRFRNGISQRMDTLT